MDPKAEFEKRTREHIRLFQLIARRLNDVVDDYGWIPEAEILYHDESKLHEPELSAYANRFCGANDNPEGWEAALAHHYATNPHHPQYWMSQSGPVLMPSAWVMAMVADWLASSVQYSGNLNMVDWLDANMGKEPTHPMHSHTVHSGHKLLRHLGWIDNADNAGLWLWVDRRWCLTDGLRPYCPAQKWVEALIA